MSTRLCGLLALCLCAGLLSAQAATPPDVFTEATAAAGEALRQLRQMQMGPQVASQEVAAVVSKAAKMLEQADALLAGQTRELDEKPAPADPRRKQELEAQRRTLMDRRCRVALLRGQLHASAAAALPGDEKARREHLESAISTFRALRILYLDSALSWAGYLEEAKAQRLAGQFDDAEKALEPILELPAAPADKVVCELRRAAMLERLEIYLSAEPARAIAEAEKWRKSPEVAGQPLWQGRIDWLLARAHAAAAAARPDGAADLVKKAAGLLRGEQVVMAAAPYDRLALLARLDALASGAVMTRAELLHWADALSTLGRLEAADSYARAEAMPGEPLSFDQQAARAGLLLKRGDLQPAADVCQAMLNRMPPDHPRRGAALRCRAAALLKLYHQAAADEPPPRLAERVLAALQAVIESKLPEEVRRDALRQWVGVSARQSGPAACVEMLDGENRLVGSDAYLLHALAAGRWAAFSASPPAGDPARAAEQARRIAADGEAARLAAEKEQAWALAGRCVLLRARVLASPPLRDPQTALKALGDAPYVFKTDGAVAAAASWLRVEALLDLGLTGEATKALAAMPASESAGPAGLRVRLAEALADRYVVGDLTARRKVVDLCNQALAAAVGQKARYAAVARSSARAMLKVGAHADARGILEKLIPSQAVQNDPAAALDCSLLLAQALEQGGKLNESKQLLAGLIGQFPQAPAAHLALGWLEMSMSQPAAAVESFRQARKLCRSGTPDWCEATLALAEGLLAVGQAPAAAEVLRVSQALYPRFGSPELLAKLKKLSDRLTRREKPGAS